MIQEVGAMSNKWVRVAIGRTPNGIDGVIAKFTTLYEARYYATDLDARYGKNSGVVIVIS